MVTTTKVVFHLEHWLGEYLPNAEGKKPKTIKSYKDTWRLMVKYFAEKGIKYTDITYELLTYDRLLGFLSWLENERHCKISTRNNRLSAISRFADYSMKQDFDTASTFYKAVSKIPFKEESDATERAYFTKEELRILLDLPTPKSNMGIRDHVLLQYMYATGARAEEVCSAKVKDVRFLEDGRASVLIHGKRGKIRRIKVFNEPAGVLKKYLSYRKISNQPDAFIFPSQRNECMSTKCLEDIFKKYVTLARKEHPDLFQESSYPPHSMRHTTAMHMLEAGVPLVVIKQFLGHEHLATTEIYAKSSPEATNEKLRSWSEGYWDEYMDQPFDKETISENSAETIPAFLK